MLKIIRNLRTRHCKGCRYEYLTRTLRFCQRTDRRSSLYTLNTAKLFCFSKKKRRNLTNETNNKRMGNSIPGLR